MASRAEAAAVTLAEQHYIGEEEMRVVDNVLNLADLRTEDTKAYLSDAYGALEEPYRSAVQEAHCEHSETTPVYKTRIEDPAGFLERRDYEQGVIEHTLRTEERI